MKKRDMKSVTILMFLLTVLVWIVLICVKHMIWGVELEALVDDIISNILGILPPIIIFNFAYEYLTKDHMASEMSKQITGTLMSDSEAIQVFDSDNKRNFIKTTIETMVGNNSVDMVYALVEPYLTCNYNVRRFFKYTIRVTGYKTETLFVPEKYLKIYENFKYKKLFIKETLSQKVRIAFLTKEAEVDKALRAHETYIFTENLKIEDEEMKKILSITSEKEKIDFIETDLNLSLYIDNMKCSINGVILTENGIDIEFESKHDTTKNEHSVEIAFSMPQMKNNTEFLVSISEPTYSPTVQFMYDEDVVEVRAFPFMNEGEESLIESSTHCPGEYEFCIQDKWIYPMSGIIFIINGKS